jgi:hypothetical protein
MSLALILSIIHQSSWAETALAVTGPEEIVFDWSADRCELEDIPDVPARAFRDADNNVQLISSHFINRRMTGADLDSLQRDCNVVMDSHMDSDPAHHNDKEWLHALYTTDGQNIHALVHNEYQGSSHAGMCPSGEYTKCWYNAVTYAFSSDKGASFSHVSAPAHLVASVPYKYLIDAGPYGIFNPGNIILNMTDGYYYSMLHLETYGVQEWGTGVMRTRTLGDPASWRCWNGTGFDAAFINPYTATGYNPAEHVCAPVSRDNINKMYDSLTYNTYLKKYVLISATGLWDKDRGEVVHGFYFSLSDDLVNWSLRRLVMEGPLWWTAGNDVDRIGIASLLDPDDPSRNFETTDDQAYLYYTRWHAGTIYDRDLVRVPVRFVNDIAFNPGLNDAWYNPETSGQGFFITVFPELGAVSLAWFTYDTELPPPDAVAHLGDPGHRWITAVGPIVGNRAIMDIEMTSGGLFDTVSAITRTDPPGSDGTIVLEFSSCNSGTVTYDIPPINRQGTVPIKRVANDNIALCEAFNAD